MGCALAPAAAQSDKYIYVLCVCECLAVCLCMGHGAGSLRGLWATAACAESVLCLSASVRSSRSMLTILVIIVLIVAQSLQCTQDACKSLRELFKFMRHCAFVCLSVVVLAKVSRSGFVSRKL